MDGSSSMNVPFGRNRFQNKDSPTNRIQPLYLQPTSPACMSPRGFKTVPVDNSSPDFIPLGYSSPLNKGNRRGSNSWSTGGGSSRFGGSRHSSSNFSSPPGSTSRFHSSYHQNSGFKNRGGQRRSNSFGSSNSFGDDDRDIAQYYHHSMVQDPWAELEQKIGLGNYMVHSKPNSDMTEPRVGPQQENMTETMH